MNNNAIRIALKNDLSSIVNIYNWAIQNTTATFDTENKTVEQQQSWFEKHDERFTIFVFEEDNIIKGWASISPWSDRRAYQYTGEVAIYIDSNYHKQGIGNRLMKTLIDHAKNNDFKTLVSKISSGSIGSVELHLKFGFIEVGCLKDVGHKNDQWLDVSLYQLMLI